jgi:DNA-binding transcriptional regulator YiaG
MLRQHQKYARTGKPLGGGNVNLSPAEGWTLGKLKTTLSAQSRPTEMEEQTSLRPSVPDIYAIRRRARHTQEQFADALGIPPNTLRSWEQQRKRPSGAARALLRLIERKPELLETLAGGA